MKRIVFFLITLISINTYADDNFKNKINLKESLRLRCVFTEPFWTIDINNGELLLTDLEQQVRHFIITKINSSMNHINKWVLSASSSKDGNIKMFIQETNNCSDDMSDLIYKYQIILDYEKENIVLSGCGKHFQKN